MKCRYIGASIKGKIDKNDLVDYISEHNFINLSFVVVMKQNGATIRLIGEKKDLLKELQTH